MAEVAVDKIMTDDVVIMDEMYANDVAVDMGGMYMEEMPVDMGMIDTPQNGGISSTVILWITIIACAVLGIALGIIFGRKSAMK